MEGRLRGSSITLSPSPISPIHFIPRLRDLVAKNFPSAATDLHHDVIERPTHVPYSSPTNGIERPRSQAVLSHGHQWQHESIANVE